MHILQITLRCTLTKTSIQIHLFHHWCIISTNLGGKKNIFWLHFSHNFECSTVQTLTPSSLLFMILMATFSPVRMCRPSLTLAKPPENTSIFSKRKSQNVEVAERGWGWTGLDITRTDGLVNLIVFVELLRAVDLRPLHRHLFHTFPQRETLLTVDTLNKVQPKLELSWRTGCSPFAPQKSASSFLQSSRFKCIQMTIAVKRSVLDLSRHRDNLHPISNLPEFVWKQRKSVVSVTAACPAEKRRDVCGWNLNLPRRRLPLPASALHLARPLLVSSSNGRAENRNWSLQL